MENDTYCWRCNAALEELILPLSRREECPQCGADQHACKLCQNYEPNTSAACKEERAEPPSNKETANFCDYFVPRSGGSHSSQNDKNTALDALNALFGEESNEQTADDPALQADTLPNSQNKNDCPQTAAKKSAEAEWKRLFD